MVVLNRLVKLSLGKFASKEKADDIANFFETRDIKGFDTGLNQVFSTFILFETHYCRVLNLCLDLRDGSNEMH